MKMKNKFNVVFQLLKNLNQVIYVNKIKQQYMINVLILVNLINNQFYNPLLLNVIKNTNYSLVKNNLIYNLIIYNKIIYNKIIYKKNLKIINNKLRQQ